MRMKKDDNYLKMMAAKATAQEYDLAQIDKRQGLISQRETSNIKAQSSGAMDLGRQQGLNQLKKQQEVSASNLALQQASDAGQMERRTTVSADQALKSDMDLKKSQMKEIGEQSRWDRVSQNQALVSKTAAATEAGRTSRHETPSGDALVRSEQTTPHKPKWEQQLDKEGKPAGWVDTASDISPGQQQGGKPANTVDRYLETPETVNTPTEKSYTEMARDKAKAKIQKKSAKVIKAPTKTVSQAKPVSDRSMDQMSNPVLRESQLRRKRKIEEARKAAKR